MKRVIIGGLLSILTGYIVGNFIFSNKDIFKFNNDKDKYYFLQEGVYYDRNVFDDVQGNLRNKILEYKDNKVYVYVGITKKQDIAEKLINIYDNKNVNLSIKEKYYKNKEFKNNIEQFDILIDDSTDEEEIIKIEEVVIANYKETIKKIDESL